MNVYMEFKEGYKELASDRNYTGVRWVWLLKLSRELAF